MDLRLFYLLTLNMVPRLKAYNKQMNEVALANAIDQLEEARDMALLNFARY